MNLKSSQNGEDRLREKFPAGIFRIMLYLFPIFTQVATFSLDSEFFGADENKINETPKYLNICHKSDKNIDKCIKSSLEKLMENLNSDSKEMNLPSIDPFQVHLLEFQQGSGNVSLHLTFKNFRIRGFKNLTIISVKSNLNDNKFEISIECPFVVMEASFSAEGGVFTFPISGEVDTLPDLKFLFVEDALMDLLPTEINAHFGDFIDGSNAIGAAFNTFFNKNSMEIFTIVKPKLSRILAEIFASYANGILSRHPEDVLLPE